MWQRVESLVSYVFTALHAVSELLRCFVQPAERFIYVEQEATFLARKQERLFALHGVRTLIRHMEAVCREITVRTLQRVGKRFVKLSQLLDDFLPLSEKALLEMRQIFLG
jgi:hypothetical protein